MEAIQGTRRTNECRCLISTVKMIMKNTPQTLELVAEMISYINEWDYDSDEEIDLEKKYSQRVKEVGEFKFIVCLFENYSDSIDVISLMSHFLFVWKDFSYQEWKELLYIFAGNSIIMYEFMWFCIDVLEIDIKKIIREDKQISELAKHHLSTEFTSILLVKTSEPGSPWTHEMFREKGMEATTMWKRLKEEGAPMKVDV